MGPIYLRLLLPIWPLKLLIPICKHPKYIPIQINPNTVNRNIEKPQTMARSHSQRRTPLTIFPYKFVRICIARHSRSFVRFIRPNPHKVLTSARGLNDNMFASWQNMCENETKIKFREWLIIARAISRISRERGGVLLKTTKSPYLPVGGTMKPVARVSCNGSKGTF